MAQEVATLEIIDDSLDWNPPAALPLNLRSHLQKFGIGSDDLVIIEGLPEGADLTVGVCKPDGSWSLGAAEIDNAAFIPLYENGETYTLKVCLLTPDPSDHGLPKMKGKAQFPLAVPLAPLPVLEAFEEPAPKKAAAIDAVIHLGADPALQAAVQPTATAPQPAAPVPIATPVAPAPAPQPAATAPIAPAPQPVTPAPTPQAAATASVLAAAPVAPGPAAPMPPIDFDKHFAALRMEWQTNVKNQVAAAERRLKAAHLQQLSKIQTVLAQEEATRTAAIAAKWKAEMERRAADAEAALKARAQEHLTGLETRLGAKAGGSGEAGSAAEFERRLAAARQQWQAEEAARLAEAVEEWRADAVRQRTALEAKLAHSYKERLAAIESAMNTKDATPSNADAAAVERAVAEARAAWEIEEGAHRAKDAADLTAAHQRQVAQLEAQYAALYEMRMTAADAAWRKAEAERLAAAELAWSKREAERVAAIEAKWRAEHDQRLSVVLANLDTMVKGQLGNVDGSQLLPAIEPAMAAPAPAQADERGPGEAPTIEDDVRWRKTAAA
jgi:hypothetical protein